MPEDQAVTLPATIQPTPAQNGFQFAVERLAEPSTWAGVAAMAGTFGLNTASPTWNGAVMAVSALAGVASIFMRERAK